MAFDVADVSEFQGTINPHAYVGASPVIILRAHNGFREDRVYGVNVKACYAEPGLASCGHYGYLPGNVDAFSAGVAFGETVKKYGGLRRQDWIACDLEEGAGDQAQRMEAWLRGAHSMLGEQQAQEFGYSGAAFWSAHLLSSTVAHRWIAAYGQSTAPALGEALWQDTDAESFPGIASKCDGSKSFVGTVAQFLALIGATVSPARPAFPSSEVPVKVIQANAVGAFPGGIALLFQSGYKMSLSGAQVPSALTLCGQSETEVIEATLFQAFKYLP